MLTFENVLEIFQEYLLRDPEEEVLPCKARLCPIDLEQRIPATAWMASSAGPRRNCLTCCSRITGTLNWSAGRKAAGEVTEADEKPWRIVLALPGLAKGALK